MAIDVEEFRSVLLEERQRTVNAIEYLHTETEGAIEDNEEEIPSGNHPADLAGPTLDREIDYTLGENSEQVLREIDEALARIDAGTFGTCDRCGRPIAEARLEAMPYATKCIDCKRLEERA